MIIDKDIIRSFIFAGLLLAFGCGSGTGKKPPSDQTGKPATSQGKAPKTPAYAFKMGIPQDVRMKDYFRTIDTLVARAAPKVSYPLTEHLLVQANPWLIDTLSNTDYYYQKSRGNFIYDQRQMVILHKGDTLMVPGDSLAHHLMDLQDRTVIDVNIPEFRLRVLEGSDTVFSCPVRVGQYRKRFLQTIERVEDLRTRPGTGAIIRINRNPVVRDPVTGKKYDRTRRDDRLFTLLPQIPWLEPELNGMRYGQMLHPTTNPDTRGKAYSNGCVGYSEADAWRVYYHAPTGTKVVFRYQLLQATPKGDTIRLRDIYEWGKKQTVYSNHKNG
jgi:L,D-transpeptidase ErfK/SrfK